MKKSVESSIKVRKENKEEKKKLFLEMFSQKANNVHMTCKALNVSRATFYKWKNDDEEFAEAVKDLEEGDIDNAETALKKQIMDGNTAAIIFYLKTKGKSRGYVEKQEYHVNQVAPDLTNLTTQEIIELLGNG
jgi:hypothetical protein